MDRRLPLCRGNHDVTTTPRVQGVLHAVPIAAQVQRERVARVVEFHVGLAHVMGSAATRRRRVPARSTGGRATTRWLEKDLKGESSDNSADHRCSTCRGTTQSRAL